MAFKKLVVFRHKNGTTTNVGEWYAKILSSRKQGSIVGPAPIEAYRPEFQPQAIEAGYVSKPTSKGKDSKDE
jgi:hypothetical protein